jgi:uncharacterized cupin superfamily protein
MMPLHAHGDEEELFFVLGGAGLLVEDGRACAIGAGDCIVHRAGGRPHTLVAGDEPLDVVAFAEGSDTHLTWLPRAGVMWAGPHWLPADAPHPFAAEAAAGPLEVPPSGPRPAHVVALDDVVAVATERGPTSVVRRDLGRAAGSRRSGLRHVEISPGRRSHPRHCHAAEEELFVVLAGSGTLLLGDDEHALRSGSLVARPPGTGVAHAFAAGDDGLTLLAYGTRDPRDLCFYPDSGKVSFRGLGVVARVQAVEYWDGED